MELVHFNCRSLYRFFMLIKDLLCLTKLTSLKRFIPLHFHILRKTWPGFIIDAFCSLWSTQCRRLIRYESWSLASETFLDGRHEIEVLVHFHRLSEYGFGIDDMSRGSKLAGHQKNLVLSALDHPPITANLKPLLVYRARVMHFGVLESIPFQTTLTISKPGISDLLRILPRNLKTTSNNQNYRDSAHES